MVVVVVVGLWGRMGWSGGGGSKCLNPGNNVRELQICITGPFLGESTGDRFATQNNVKQSSNAHILIVK